jgi:uncharacterized protein YecT (DUF1311 family)
VALIEEPGCRRKRVKSFAIVIVLVIIGSRCFGQNSAGFKNCADKAQTQFELDKCASDDAERADQALNTAYRGFLAKIAGDSLAIEKLKAAEAAWIRYRDAYIEAVYPARDKQLAYGTEYPMDVDLLRAKITREHLAAISDLINEYQPTN